MLCGGRAVCARAAYHKNVGKSGGSGSVLVWRDGLNVAEQPRALRRHGWRSPATAVNDARVALKTSTGQVMPEQDDVPTDEFCYAFRPFREFESSKI